MITLELTPIDKLRHRASILVQTHGREDEKAIYSGTTDELREQLRPIYLAHLHLLVKDLRTLCGKPNKWVEDRSQKLLEMRLEYKGNNFQTDHVAFAKDLRQFSEFLPDLLPSNNNWFRAQRLMEHIIATAKSMATSEESLWVRGSIDLLDGTTVHPWVDAHEKQQAA